MSDFDFTNTLFINAWNLYVHIATHRIAVGRAGASSEHVDQHVFVLPSYEAKKNWLVSFINIYRQTFRTDLLYQLSVIISIDIMNSSICRWKCFPCWLDLAK